MGPAFSNLRVPPDLACDFLGVFARSEYELKAVGFVCGNEKDAGADWNAFAKAISKSFDASKTRDLRAAVNYLLMNPSKKLVLKNNRLAFSDARPYKNQSETHQVLLMVRRVRNNLFHGGKFLPVPVGDPDRDKLLVQHSLTVLRACMPLHHGVSAAYADSSF